MAVAALLCRLAVLKAGLVSAGAAAGSCPSGSGRADIPRGDHLLLQRATSRSGELDLVGGPVPPPVAFSAVASLSGCQDDPPNGWQHCSTYRRLCRDATHGASVRTYCRATCDVCPPSTPTPTPMPRPPAGVGGCRALSRNSGPVPRDINIVLVPSGFRGDMAKYESEVRRIYQEFSRHKPFDADNIPALKVWYVDVQLPEDNGYLCRNGLHGISQLMHCKHPTNGYDYLPLFLKHAWRHCGSGKVMDVLVVHNSNVYGGAGSEPAITSINRLSPVLAMHELGHSVFGLGDEYHSGHADSHKDPNCDHAGCSKWADLIGRFGVGCKRNKCHGGEYYAADDTIMDKIHQNQKFGAVNERITCCKYVYHANAIPGYCKRFNRDGLDLLSYCNGRLWRGRYTDVPALLQRNASDVSLPLGEAEADPQGAPYVRVRNPVAWTIVQGAEDGRWECLRDNDLLLQEGVYHREMVEGDVDVDRGPEHNGSVAVEVLAEGGEEVLRTITFFAERSLEVPPDVDGGDAHEGHAVFEARSSILLVLSAGERCRARGSTPLAASVGVATE